MVGASDEGKELGPSPGGDQEAGGGDERSVMPWNGHPAHWEGSGLEGVRLKINQGELPQCRLEIW